LDPTKNPKSPGPGLPEPRAPSKKKGFWWERDRHKAIPKGNL